MERLWDSELLVSLLTKTSSQFEAIIKITLKNTAKNPSSKPKNRPEEHRSQRSLSGCQSCGKSSQEPAGWEREIYCMFYPIWQER